MQDASIHHTGTWSLQHSKLQYQMFAYTLLCFVILRVHFWTVSLTVISNIKRARYALVTSSLGVPTQWFEVSNWSCMTHPRITWSTFPFSFTALSVCSNVSNWMVVWIANFISGQAMLVMHESNNVSVFSSTLFSNFGWKGCIAGGGDRVEYLSQTESQILKLYKNISDFILCSCGRLTKQLSSKIWHHIVL